MAKHGSGVGLMKEALRNLNPWKIIEEDGGFFVAKKDTGEKVHKKPHPNRKAAQDHLAALNAAEGAGKAESSAVKSRGKTGHKTGHKKTTGHNTKKKTTGHLGSPTRSK